MRQHHPFFILGTILLSLILGAAARAQDSGACGPPAKRALVLSGGGLKGAFQAGAVYHLVVHRGCDFHEFAGVSVGSLNAVILAQAPRDADPEVSLHNLAERAEHLVRLWESIQSPKQVLKPRWPGWKWALFFRFGFFGTENLYSFDPLMKLIRENVDVDALAEKGRPVRVGSASFWDGTYREIGPTARFPNNDRQYFLQYVFASTLIPVVGKMPRIPQADDDADPRHWLQFGDGGLLHNTPILPYFHKCPPDEPPTAQKGHCRDWFRAGTPPPLEVEQLFVVITGPYSRHEDTYPIQQNLLAKGTKQVTDGRKVLYRTLDIVLESAYRGDLNLMSAANDFLEWRRKYYESTKALLQPEQREQFEKLFAQLNQDFPVNSYNPASAGDWSLPYRLGMVMPDQAYSGTLEVNPKNIAEQFYRGCLAAAAMMQAQFRLPPMKEKCEERFPQPPPESAKANK